jgi:hypothetical protein
MKPPPAEKPQVTAADICKQFELGPAAAALLQPTLLPRPFLDMLIEKGHHEDAARFTAHALPRREAIWWGCLCARTAYGGSPPEKEAAALQAVEAWVARPTDEQRRAAFKAGEVATFKNPTGLLGMAVYFSSGSLAPPGQAEVPPAPHLCPNAVANAVLLAAVLSKPGLAKERYPQFLALALEVANGKNRWK